MSGMTRLLPILPLRDIVVFPHRIVPLFVGRDKSVAALEAAMAADKQLFLVAQLDPNEDDPDREAMYDLGVTATAMQLTDFPCIVTGPQGVAKLGREVFATMMEHARHSIGRAELTDMQVRLVRDDVAVVAYKVHEEVEVDGVPVQFEAADSSTWVRRNGHWACAAHAEALLGDAFGRDRHSS